MRKEKINILFLNLTQDLNFGALAGKLAKVDKIIFRRGSALPIKNRIYTKFYFRDCLTGIIANSQATKETILVNTSDWLDEAKIKVIYNGIKLDEIKAEIVKPGINIREEFGIKPEEILIANVGRLLRQKGHRYLIETVKCMVDKGIKGFKVTIAGGGGLESEIKAQVKELGLEDCIF